MFIPNNFCYIRRRQTTTDLYAQITYAYKERIPYGLVRLDLSIEDSTVRADSSATRGNVKEYHDSGRILVPASVKPKFEDLFIIEGYVLKAKGVTPMYSVLGRLDHYQVELTKTSDEFNDEKL